MRSRGNIYGMGAGARKSLVLFWSALFVCSLLLQYVVAASPVLAVHDDGLFELDGNAFNGPAAGDDWDQVFNNTSNADAAVFATDGVPERSFTGGGSKDILDTDQWLHTLTSVPDKDDLQHAFAALYGDKLYYGADRYANNGDAALGFWFFKNGINVNPDGTFSPKHAIGDLFVVSHFTNGGSTSEIQLYEWVGSGGTDGALNLKASGQNCTAAPALDEACAVANDIAQPSPWPYTPKSGAANIFPANSFFEGGLDLGLVYAGTTPPCFSSFLVETRSSQEPNAQQKDFVSGSFNTCVPPTITTQSSASSVDFGGSVTDSATLSGTDGPASGTVTFFVCGPSASAPDCSTGGTQVGSPVPVSTTSNGGTATSAAYNVGVTAAAAGTYCWRAEYTPDSSSQYLAGSHTNTTTECFTVDPATISITKTANPAGPVSAGAEIGFDVTVANNGTQTTLGVHVTDPLPAGVTWAMDTPTGSTTSLVCSITGAPGSQTLDCTKPSLAAGASFSVHVHGVTDAADCGTVSNTASVGTSNDGSDSDTASVVVQCPDIKVTKTPDGASINAGDTATFSITVENIGSGTATGVTVSDNLPAGQHWTESETDCSISGADGSQVLTCNVGTLAPGASKTYSVSAVTDATDCGPINNTASASATNEPSGALGNNSDSGSITVLCAQIDIAKTADNGTVNAGDQIGFTITVTNNGAGTAYGVSASDTLNSAFSWALAPDSAGWTLVGNALSFSAASMAAGASSSVHVVATSTAEDCGVVNNTASVTTTNDGSDQDSASVTIQCPDIHVAKTANPAGPVSAGDQIGFDVTISNSGPGDAYGAEATDVLPGTGWSIDGAANGWSLNGSTLSYGPATLLAGASATVHVVRDTTSADCGVVPNTVTGFATNEPAASQPNIANADVTVMCPDVTVVKSAVNTPVSAGDPIAFDITVSNSGAAGTGTAYGVTLTDQLPDGIDWSEDSDACSITGTGNDQVLNCSWASLAPGASATVRISGTTSSAVCGNVYNLATVEAVNEPAANTGNNSDDATVVVNCPDIHVSKTADNSPINAGEIASFTITVSNDGPGRAYNVELKDTLPAGITWVPDNQLCTIDAGVLTCPIGTLDSLASFTVTISGETTVDNCGTIPNTASATASNESAADAEDNSGSAEIVVNCPLIAITKTADDPVVNATDQIGFTITVTNTGEGSAFGVTVSDTLPANGGLGWSIDAANSDAGFSIANGELSYGPATLAAGASVSVHIISATTPATCGTVDNTASMTYQGGSGSDDAFVTVNCPDVVLSKTADNSPILAGQTASYTITVWNQGDGTAYNVVVTDNLPAGIDWSVDNQACSIANGVLTCDLGDIAANADPISIVVSGATSVADCGNLPNEATAAADNEAAADTENNTDDANIVVQCASISLVKTAGTAADGDEFVTEPGTVTFTYLVTNTGTAALQNITLVDDNATPADTSDDVTVTCPQSALAAGAWMTCTADLPVGFGLRTNVAEVTASPVLGEGQVSATDDAVVRVPQLTITKAITAGAPGGAPIVEGDKVTYTLTYDLTNGPVDNGIITDVLPDGLTYLAGTATGSDEFTFVGYDDATRTLTWTAATVTKDGSVGYQVEAAVGSADLDQPLVNTATIDSDQTQPDSDTASVSVGKVEELTPPPTSTIDRAPEASAGNGLLLLLVAIVGFMLVAGVLAPTPARARRRNRRG